MDSMVQGQLKEWFVLMATFGLFGWVAYLGASSLRRKQKNEMQKALLEKFSSAHRYDHARFGRGHLFRRCGGALGQPV
jgi:hypothetical protein